MNFKTVKQIRTINTYRPETFEIHFFTQQIYILVTILREWDVMPRHIVKYVSTLLAQVPAQNRGS